MLDAGMDVARLNFSHGDHKSHGAMVDKLRAALKERPEKTCAIMLDTKGPEIRTGMLESAPVEFKIGQDLIITTDYEFKGNSTKISCSYEELPTTVKIGDIILMADGSVTCKVKECRDVS
jgi:pyruvate kinase